MELDREGARLAMLKMANARALNNPFNTPMKNVVHSGEGMCGEGMTGGSYTRVVGGRKKRQTKKDKYDEHIGMEIEEMGELKKDQKKYKKGGSKKRGRPSKQKLLGRTDERFAMKLHQLGKEYGEAIRNEDPETHKLVGSGFWSDFADGFKRGFLGTTKVIGDIASAVPIPEAQALSMGAKGLHEIGRAIAGDGKSKRKPRKASARMKQRGALVSKLMKEEGMTLGQASRYIKEHNLM